MGDINNVLPTNEVPPAALTAKDAPNEHIESSSSAAFHAQLDSLSQPPAPPVYHDGQSHALHMVAVANALPQSRLALPNAQNTLGHGATSNTPQSYGTHSVPQQAWDTNRMGQFNATRTQPMQQYPYPPYAILQPGQQWGQQIQHNGGFSTNHQYHVYNHGSPGDSSGSIFPQQFSNVGHMQMVSSVGIPSSSTFRHYPQHLQRRIAPAPVPPVPRGPPRKANQGKASLWVGNLPPAVTVSGLKDHFSRDLTEDIVSVFLISKSNCAFVNYDSEAACSLAVERFHNSSFNGIRLACRLRRELPSTSGPTAAATTSTSKDRGHEEAQSPAGDATEDSSQGPIAPLVVRSSPQTVIDKDSAATAKPVAERFFIIKSLTTEDLESSVSTRLWATQDKNEDLLNQAFEEAENVYLIFSANKSGEYFGCARMTSLISGEPVNLGTSAEPVGAAALPHVTLTPATASAPRGYIHDDSRGSIFWEADRSDLKKGKSDDADDVDDADNAASEKRMDATAGTNLGRQFSIQWISTNRVSFHRVRGLRNPWNSNREIKIARDGTEIEPGVGRRLVQMFYRAPQM